MKNLTQILLPGNEASDQLEAALANGLMRVDQCRSDFVKGLPVQEAENIQLGPGNDEYLSRRICGQDVIVVAKNLAPKMVIHAVPEKDRRALFMSINPRSDLVFNGRSARPFDVFLSAGPDGYTTVGDFRFNIGIGIRKTRIFSACAALASVGEEDDRLNALVLPREQNLGQRLHHALMQSRRSPATPASGNPGSQCWRTGERSHLPARVTCIG
jgi:hypothetical protein